MTLGRKLTGSISRGINADRLTPTIHAGSTGLTGLTGSKRAHVYANVITDNGGLIESISRTHHQSTLTLITLLRASVYAGSSLTGVQVQPDSPCNESKGGVQ